jgi:hypothetical protein
VKRKWDWFMFRIERESAERNNLRIWTPFAISALPDLTCHLPRLYALCFVWCRCLTVNFIFLRIHKLQKSQIATVLRGRLSTPVLSGIPGERTCKRKKNKLQKCRAGYADVLREEGKKIRREREVVFLNLAQ